MSHIFRDIFTGSLIVIGGTFISLAAVIVLFILWIFFNILGWLFYIFFFVFLFFAAIWLIGFLYRKARE